MGYSRQKVIDIALNEVGYLEKGSNSSLDSKTGNAGYNNYTKYARDLNNAGYYNGNKNGYAWCDVFVDWCFYKAYGKSVGQSLECQTGDLGAGCGFSAQYYKNKGQFYTRNPQPGDQIFFGSASNVTHTGLVYAVDGSKVYTVEGNTSGSSGVVANGGGVFKKSYSLSYSKIYGYGRPKYGDNYTSTTTTSSTSSYTRTQFIKDVQSACGAKIDGIAGTETLSKTVTLSAKKNNKHAAVKAVQKRLKALGYSEVGTADGEAGPKFTSAVAHFQQDNACVVDGVITARMKTWKKLLGLA